MEERVYILIKETKEIILVDSYDRGIEIQNNIYKTNKIIPWVIQFNNYEKENN